MIVKWAILSEERVQMIGPDMSSSYFANRNRFEMLKSPGQRSMSGHSIWRINILNFVMPYE